MIHTVKLKKNNRRTPLRGRGAGLGAGPPAPPAMAAEEQKSVVHPKSACRAGSARARPARPRPYAPRAPRRAPDGAGGGEGRVGEGKAPLLLRRGGPDRAAGRPGLPGRRATPSTPARDTAACGARGPRGHPGWRPPRP